MDYKNYQYSRDAAWRILIDCHVTKLPVRVLDICRRLDIRVRRTVPTEGSEGRSLILGGQPVILLAEGPSQSGEGLRWRMSWGISCSDM